MLEIFKTYEGMLKKIDKVEDGCWIDVKCPTEEEKKFLLEEIKILPDFLKQALDEEESPHIDYDEGIISNNKYIITISLHESLDILDFKSGLIRGFNTNMKTRFFLSLMLRISQRYLAYLRQIDKISSLTETKLHRSMENEELIQMLALEKSLVYFSTSLKTDEVIMNKIMRGKVIKLYEEDQDLLEDVLIELHQAIEMCNIYSNILSGTMDAFASIISNNLNIVMKVLAVITIVMSIPNIVFGFYGMNVDNLPGAIYWFIPLIITIVICVVLIIFFKKKKMFK